MIAKLTKALFVWLAFILLTANVSGRQPTAVHELVGSYFAGHDFGGKTLTLNLDGSYVSSFGTCTLSTEESGRYSFFDGVLHFTILKYTGKHNGRDVEVDLLNSEGRKEIFGYGNDAEVVPYKTTYELIPVKWSERVYLIYESDLRDFSNAINLGLEPRATVNSDPYYGPFFLRAGDETKRVREKPALPIEWQSFILHKPFTAKIIAIEEQGDTKIALINRGSRSGLKPGMILASQNERPTPWSKDGLVLSVNEKTAKVQIFSSKVGDALSTKYDRSLFDRYR